MSILADLKAEILAEDGTWLVFLIHKLSHICGGAIMAYVVAYLTGNLFLGAVAALVMGICRELMKTTGMRLHILTALITASGAGLAILMQALPLANQLVILGAMVVYVIVVTVRSEMGLYP